MIILQAEREMGPEDQSMDRSHSLGVKKSLLYKRMTCTHIKSPQKQLPCQSKDSSLASELLVELLMSFLLLSLLQVE
jgi:hypothetical protein